MPWEIVLVVRGCCFEYKQFVSGSCFLAYNRANFHDASFHPGGSVMPTETLWDRRSVLRAAGVGAVAALTVRSLPADEPHKVNGNIKQSICRWCYGRIKLEDLAKEAVKIGFKSIELLTPEDIKKVKEFDLTCAVMRCKSGIVSGLNRKENHERIIKELRDDIDFAVAEGIPCVLTMSGNRQKMADDDGLANCTAALKQVVGYAEEKKVTILMEG